MTISGKIFLKKGKEQSLHRFHPWIFSGAIRQTQGDLSNGNWVEVLDHHGNTLGFGHYQTGSIAVRVLAFGQEKPSAGFWEKKMGQAVALRTALGLPSQHTNACRLIHAEGDGLPGLIIDLYNGTAVMQAHSAGMHLDREPIGRALKNILGDSLKAIYYKSKATLPGTLRDESSDGYLLGDVTVPQTIVENGNAFLIDWVEGQKTGFFLDQRENRQLLASYSSGKQVLNTFCYTGGFSVYALKGGATRVHSVDASAKAVALTRENLLLNGFDPEIHSCFATDTFDFLKGKEGQYDIIILDPPAFAKHRDARHQAVKGYQRLNAEAMRVVKPGGMIFTFSCSQVIGRQLFYDTIVSAAIQANRSIKVLHQLSQAPDHPVSIFHPEGEYLKGLVLYVE